ncbi:hypothetical protein FIL93_00015 [SAR202 cluster bacterium AD-493-K16_JPT_193m]|nr:hypothetical protein [SAR202 cluster bacterium AD-493-K16_JPT_193m]
MPKWNLQQWALLFAMLLIGVDRMVRLDDFPVIGADGAHYLLTMRRVFGEDPTAMGLVRPPMLGFILKPLVIALGETSALKVIGVVGSVVIALPFYKLSFRVLGQLPRPFSMLPLLITFGFLFSVQYAEMLAFGTITFWGIFLVQIVILKACDVVIKGGLLNTFILALLILFLFATHQTSFVVGIGTIGIYAFYVICSKTKDLLNRKPNELHLSLLIVALLTGAVMMLPILSVYVRQVQSIGPEWWLNTVPNWDGLLFEAREFYRDSYLLWVFVAGFSIIGAGTIFFARSSDELIPLIAMALVPLLINVLGMGIGARALMFTYVPCWILGALGVAKIYSSSINNYQLGLLPKSIRVISSCSGLAIVSACVLVQSFMWADRLEERVHIFSSIDEETIGASSFVANTFSSVEPVIAYPVTFGMWLQGAHGHNAYEVGSSSRFQERDESYVGQAVLSGSHLISNGLIGVSWTHPYSPNSTNVFLKTEQEYQSYMSIDESASTVSTSLGGSIRTHTLEEATRVFDLNIKDESASGALRYRGDNFSAVQESHILQRVPQANFRYDFESIEGDLDEIVIMLALNSRQTLKADTDGVSTVTATYLGRSHSLRTHLITTTLEAKSDNAKIGIELLNDSIIRVSVIPNAGVKTLGLELNLKGSGFKSQYSSIRYFETKVLLKDHGISAVAVDIAPINLLMPLGDNQLNWLEKSGLFGSVYRSGRMLVYKINTEA